MKNTKHTTSPVTNLPNLLDTTLANTTVSSEPSDGTFIGDDDLHDGFSARGTVRYGEETDADDL
ncbi:MAG: hypothetical protein ACRCTE_07800 [Cellulosilyticaceae bacterium]